jgi:hypothetical protein
VKALKVLRRCLMNDVEFTEDDIDSCWPHYKSYLLDILNGEYTTEAAREDLRGLIGSRYDSRVNEL